MTKWRWDQGRLLYFEFDVIRLMAKQLLLFDGQDIKNCEPLFRSALMNGTGMPFAPEHYTVKRNYSRVFQCTFLANFVEDKLVVTDFCKQLADDNGDLQTPDDYFINFVNKFRFPFPAFQDYNVNEPRVYPFCAIIKLLLAFNKISLADARIEVEDVFSYLVANHCTGLEPLDYYTQLTPKNYDFSNDEKRQVREMLVFMSQLSFLKVHNHLLYLDSTYNKEVDDIYNYLHPIISTPLVNRVQEFYSITQLKPGKIVIPQFEAIPTVDFAGVEFKEGDRKRTEHFRIERSSLLKKYYKLAYPEPVCRACQRHIKQTYPWTDYMLEIHHLLPLAMSIKINYKGTSLEDLVGLCPNCHRAIHMFYNKWLKENDQKDFRSKAEAMDIYLEAIHQIAI
ncbi:MAG: HNH endonuclease [Lachnoclostridium sp.]|nr:HNH endonuclease [Lachnoclostridium sp.]